MNTRRRADSLSSEGTLYLVVVSIRSTSTVGSTTYIRSNPAR